MNMGLKAFQIMEFVNLLWGVAISYNWIKRLKTKWKSELSKKKTKLLADKRTNKILSDDVLDFIGQVEVVKEVHPMTAKNSFNYNETQVYVSSDGTVCFEHVGKDKPHHEGTKGKTIGSPVTFICADGSVFMSVWIFKRKPPKGAGTDGGLKANIRVPMGGKYNLRDSWPRYYCWTDTGYSNTELHHAIIGKFGRLWKLKKRNQFYWLFEDQLGCHKSLETVRQALLSNVMSWLLPGNTSHFLQPLDNLAFAKFKQTLRVLAERMIPGHNILKEELISFFYEVAYKAECIVFTKRVIQRSFAKVGLFPFDKERILLLVKTNV